MPTNTACSLIGPKGRFAVSSFAISLFLIGVSCPVQALNLDIKNYWVRDYMDFGQNKGIFKPGATDLVIQGKDGSLFKLPELPFPNFDVVENHGPATSIGGAYMITALHNKDKGDWQEYCLNPEFGLGRYHTKDFTAVDDFAALRLNKFVVETPGVTTGVDNSLKGQAFLDRYGTMYQGKKQAIIYRTGSGVLQLRSDVQNKLYDGVAYQPGLRSGSIMLVYLDQPYAPNPDSYVVRNFLPFDNRNTTGDSGSAALVYDNELKRWVVLGVLERDIYSGSGEQFFLYNRWEQDKVNEIKNKYTHKIALDKGNLTFTGNNEYSIDGKQDKFAAQKDLSFSGGGDITLTHNLDLGIGGLIFDEQKDYTVEGKDAKGNAYYYKGAGVDIGKDSVVNWNIKGTDNDSLHKIGEGKLIVNTTQGNNLRVGNGTVELNASNAFNQVYLASGLATVKLMQQDALNSSHNMKGVYFSRGGGILDLNGFSQTFQRIAASDNGAIISNTGHTHADVTLQLPKGKYAYHGQFKDSINVKHEYQDEADDKTKFDDRHLILDGGMNITGSILIKNAQLTMQGLPTTHAIFGSRPCELHIPGIISIPNYCGDAYNNIFSSHENAINNKLDTHYKTNNEPNSFKQPDWETRTYKFDTLKLDKSQLAVGRNTNIIGNIEAKDSQVQFGGNVTVFRDNVAGSNVTAKGNDFDFRQQLYGGQSRADDTIVYDGDIRSDNSQFVSYMKYAEASFDLKNNSSFEAMDLSSLTVLRDKGIKLSGNSKLILGDIAVSGNQNQNLITIEPGSTLSVQNVTVSKGLLQLPDNVVKGALQAGEDGKIFVNNWQLENENLVSKDSGLITINNLSTKGPQHAYANLSLVKELNMKDVNPHKFGAREQEWVGLQLNKLTLGNDVKISAELSNDYLSINNMDFTKEHILVNSQELNDNRSNKNIDFITLGENYYVNSAVKGHQIVFNFSERPVVDDTVLQGSVYEQFLASNKHPNGEQILNAIISHNQVSDNKYQEVAIKDALSSKDISAGVEALNNIVNRTNTSFKETARTLSQKTLLQPIRSAITSRLASLRRAARNPVAPAPLTDALGNFYGLPKAKEEDILLDSVYADVNTAWQKEGSRSEHLISSNLGFDTIRAVDGGRVVFGGAFSFTKIHNTDTLARDSGKMYSLTGYVSYEQKSGWEYQSYLTAGVLNNDRSFIPEITLGQQNFDERSYMLMSSNYIKYHYRAGGLAVRPMALVDVGYSRTCDSESAFFKRDKLDQVTVDIGFGLELEGSYESIGYSLQATARHNFWTSDNTVGINLRNAQGYISYDVPLSNDTYFNIQGSISKRLQHNISLDLGIGANASTGGSKGVNGNARIRWHF